MYALGLIAAPFAGCGPDAKPDPLCDGPTFNLLVIAEPGPLPDDTRINVRYGGNHEGEPYTLGQSKPGQSVFCEEHASWGGASAVDDAQAQAGAGGAPSTSSDGKVEALTCRLFTQGPARVDATASGYEPIVNQELELDDKQRCQVDAKVTLMPSAPDAGE